MAAHAGIGGRFAAASFDGELLGQGPVPSYVRVPVGPGWALVGDAGLHQDPWSGFGMDMASTHATFLAEALSEHLEGVPEREALAGYHRRRNDHALETYRMTTELGKDLRRLAA